MQMNSFIAVKDWMHESVEKRVLKYHLDMIQMLSEKGDELAWEAYGTKKRGNKTFNQRDAYGWAVYYNKALITHGFIGDKVATKPATGSFDTIYGRDEIENAINNYVPSSDGYVLIIANAIWYSITHELNKEPVISQILPDLLEIAEVYGGTATIEGI